MNRGFSLIEALMAVLILGIGLLGLGALLPVVAKQQRDSADQTFGTAAGTQALALLAPPVRGRGPSIEASFLIDAPVAPVPLRVVVRGSTYESLFTGAASDAEAVREALVRPPVRSGDPPSLAAATPVVAIRVTPESPTTDRLRVSVRVEFGGIFAGAVFADGDLAVTLDGAAPRSEDLVKFLGQPALVPGFWSRWRLAQEGTTAYQIPGLEWTTGLANTDAGYWLPVSVDDGSTSASGVAAARAGDLVLGATADENRGSLPRSAQFRIPLADRLWPQDAGGLDPQFVWDVAVQMDPALPTRVRAAVFVRRVDPKIRVASGVSVYEALTQRRPGERDFRLPVSLDLPAARPALDGSYDQSTRAYSTPMAVPVEFRVGDHGERDRLVVLAPTSDVDTSLPPGLGPSGASLRGALASMMAQPGQQLVDNLGTVHTVLGIDNRLDASDSLRPFTLRLARPVAEIVPQTDRSDPQTIRQVVFTPQVPARVLVEVMNP